MLLQIQRGVRGEITFCFCAQGAFPSVTAGKRTDPSAHLHMCSTPLHTFCTHPFVCSHAQPENCLSLSRKCTSDSRILTLIGAHPRPIGAPIESGYRMFTKTTSAPREAYVGSGPAAGTRGFG